MSDAVDISDLPSPDVDISDLPAPTSSATWMNAAKGVGQTGLALGAGALRAVNLAANDILPESFFGGPGARAAMRQRIEQDPILGYRGGPESAPITNALSDITRPIAKVGSAIHQGISDLTSPRTADVATDILTLAPGARGAFGKAGAESAIEEGHPLTQAAQAESGRLAGFKSAASDAGLDLPEGGTPDRHAEAAFKNRPIVNDIARKDLQLPANAPLTSEMLDAARSQYVSPAYRAIEGLKEPIDVGNSIAALEGGRARFNPDLPAPQGPISGADAVRFSQDARFEARTLDRQVNMGNPAAASQARLYRQAAQTVEDAVETHLNGTDQGQLAKDWDTARVYAAKSHAYEDALDGAGNVRVTDLKRQLFTKGKPFTGPQEMLATLGAQYPEAFKTTRITMPRAGPIRRAASGALPIAGGILGAAVGGEAGAGLGTAAGEYARNRVLNP